MSPFQNVRGLSVFLPVLFSLAFTVSSLSGQTAAAPAKPAAVPSTPSDTDDTAFFNNTPVVRGINLAAGITMQHDSADGYSWIFTPTGSYRFNSAFSFEVGAPIFMLQNVSQQLNFGTKAKPILGYGYVPKRGIVGDTAIATHFDIHPDVFDYSFTGTIGFPTGTPAYGVGAGQVTYNLNNHFEHTVGPFSPDIELGIGDSSALTSTAIQKSYLAIGLLAYFQAGTSVDLTHHIGFEADAYEQLPLDRNTIYTTTGKGKKAVTTATTTGAAEDNGFTTQLDIPLNTHATLSGFYNHSLRDHDDTAGFTVTFSLRPPPRDEEGDVDLDDLLPPIK